MVPLWLVCCTDCYQLHIRAGSTGSYLDDATGGLQALCQLLPLSCLAHLGIKCPLNSHVPRRPDAKQVSPPDMCMRLLCWTVCRPGVYGLSVSRMLPENNAGCHVVSSVSLVAMRDCRNRTVPVSLQLLT